MANEQLMVNVRCRDIPFLKAAVLMRVDASGGFLATEGPMPVGTMLVVSPTSDESVQVPARVAQVLEARKSSTPQEPPGMRLTFEAMGERLLPFVGEAAPQAQVPSVPAEVEAPVLLEPPPFVPRTGTSSSVAQAPAPLAEAPADPPAPKVTLEIIESPQVPQDVPIIVLTPRAAAEEAPVVIEAEAPPATAAPEAVRGGPGEADTDAESRMTSEGGASSPSVDPEEGGVEGESEEDRKKRGRSRRRGKKAKRS